MTNHSIVTQASLAPTAVGEGNLRRAAGLAITALSFEIERAFERRDTAACLQMKEAKDALIEALEATR